MESQDIFKPAASSRFLKQGVFAMTKRFTFEILDNGEAVLRDGETLTHRMMMRDSADPRQIALDATEALKVRDAQVLAASRKPGFVYSSVLDSQASARAAARQSSYDSYDRDISTAWQRKDTVIADAAVDPRAAWHDARAQRDSAPPLGAYPASSGEGTVCTINGKPGHLRSTGNGGWLACEADDHSGNGMDSRAAVMDAAYAAVDEELKNAWRKPAHQW
jgi:hypothetical protein